MDKVLDQILKQANPPLWILILVFILLSAVAIFRKEIISWVRGKLLCRRIFLSECFKNLDNWRVSLNGNPNNSLRTNDGQIIFQANKSASGGYGPNKEIVCYIDIEQGVEDGRNYVISCVVRATPGSTMTFQLWVHDTEGGASEVSRRFPPKHPKTPSSKKWETFTIHNYPANFRNALRVHLVCFPGDGEICVKRVTVSKRG